ncbi:hypothetical protein PG996_004885 [Apiospora saccharicola]|uniref:Uncharacterized protein n=1 Tax=Apiospora saccharicola TaxID=335842 RepID=A0ABR1VJY2_9PEZI
MNQAERLINRGLTVKSLEDVDYGKGKGKEVATPEKLEIPLCLAGYMRTIQEQAQSEPTKDATLLIERDPSNFLLNASSLAYTAGAHNVQFEPVAPSIEQTVSLTTNLGSIQELS